MAKACISREGVPSATPDLKSMLNTWLLFDGLELSFGQDVQTAVGVYVKSFFIKINFLALKTSGRLLMKPF